MVVELPSLLILLWELAWSRGLPISRYGYPTPVLALKDAIQYAGGVTLSTFANRMAVDVAQMPFYSSGYSRASYTQGNQFDLGNTGLTQKQGGMVCRITTL